MADGTKKAIKDVKVGDKVMASDPETGVLAAESVTATHIHDDVDLLDLTVHTDGGDVVISTTVNHPIYDDTSHGWVLAGDAFFGHNIRTIGGKRVWVEGSTAKPGHGVRFNLTVDRLHTFYVIAGDEAILVHNGAGTGVSGTVFRDGGYVFQIYSNDHGPPHGHLKGAGYDIQIGQNGKPLNDGVELTTAQRKIIDRHLPEIRAQIKKKCQIMTEITRRMRVEGGAEWTPIRRGFPSYCRILRARLASPSTVRSMNMSAGKSTWWQSI